MPRVKQASATQTTRKKSRPALSEEAREKQLIALAVDLVEERLLNGTASSQETTHFLKLGSQKNRLEMERLEKENELLRAKTESIQSQQKQEEMYAEVLRAMRRYSGQGDSDEY